MRKVVLVIVLLLGSMAVYGQFEVTPRPVDVPKEAAQIRKDFFTRHYKTSWVVNIGCSAADVITTGIALRNPNKEERNPLFATSTGGLRWGPYIAFKGATSVGVPLLLRRFGGKKAASIFNFAVGGMNCPVAALNMRN